MSDIQDRGIGNTSSRIRQLSRQSCAGWRRSSDAVPSPFVMRLKRFFVPEDSRVLRVGSDAGAMPRTLSKDRDVVARSCAQKNGMRSMASRSAVRRFTAIRWAARMCVLTTRASLLAITATGRLYGASYDMAETNQRHTGERHEYLLCRTPMDADVLINLPKLKTHKKVGVTCALKNLVGINANKNWLPHHTEGTPDQGGDQFPAATHQTRLEHSWMGTAKRWLKNRPRLSRLFVPVKKIGRLFFGDTQKVVRSGNWHGNDTCWRMVLDLNKCLCFFDGTASRRNKPFGI